MRRSFYKLVFLASFALSALPNFSYAEPAPKGETELKGYIDFRFFDDRGIGWSGSETTFLATMQLDLTHKIYDDVSVRFSGEYKPTVGDHSRAYAQMREREGSLEDSYILLNNPGSGKDSALRLGVVKVPFGHFNTFGIEDRNRPITLMRTREWDYGVRFDKRYGFMDMAFAIINGEGRNGTDANSSKSVALRVSYPAGFAASYPETERITDYPNPLKANPTGALLWNAGLSGYVGNKYTTPIKEKNIHAGIDFTVSYSRYSLKGQATYMEGGFNNRSFDRGAFNATVPLNQYGSAVVFDLNTFPKAYSLFLELTAGISEKITVGGMFEYYDPDSQSSDTVRQMAKERGVLGIKYDYRPGVTSSLFYTINNDPAFGETGNVVQSDDWKGDNVIMAVMAVQF